MPFGKVSQAVPNFPELERRILELWKAGGIFERSLEISRGRPDFVFYEGPPTANGLPHNGHVLTRAIKDLFPRYMTMRGHHVERRAGWDTHGLPVEVEVEKELGISGKEAIVEYGVDRFSKKCMQSVFRYTEEWEHLTERIGFWVNLDEAYVTFHKKYVESVWWALSELFKKGLLYQGHKVVWWWAQGGTALSSGEVGNAYKTVDDPSVYVRFRLVDEDASLVVWTTTPWTLPSNTFAAVHADFDYAYVRDAETGQTLVLAEKLVEALAEKLGRPLEVVRVVKGASLVGRRYHPPYDIYAKDLPKDDPRYFRVVEGNKARTGTPQWFVTLEAGTGVVHLAPAFGEDDWKVWRNEQMKDPTVEMFCAVRPDGKFDARLRPLGLEGVWVKDADRVLEKDLRERGLLVHGETYRHEYPFCWRSDNDPLIQYARNAWFIRTTERIDGIIENNRQVAWMPEHIREGRMGDFLASNVDWALSRERFWGTPLNIWTCADCGHQEAPASCAEIEKKNPDAFAHFREAQARDPEISEHLMVHKPWIDEVTYPCPTCPGTLRRIPEVIDCWFDSGCMPFAQLGYPHLPGSKEAFETSFPADFISEAIDQTRGWFYSLMAVSNLLFDKAPSPHSYRRCIVLGLVLDKQGKKESKSRGNYTPPEVILDAVAMDFAVVDPADAPYARGLKPEVGEGWIAREDLEGLDLQDGSPVELGRRGAEREPRKIRLKAHKKFPRRVIALSDEDRTALGLSFAPPESKPATVPTLPGEQRVRVESKGVPAPGADAFRWFFYAANPPWNNTRHALSNVRAVQKELPIKLRNVFSFFVTYANIDGFDPVRDEPARRPAKERSLLDRWILSELERTKRVVVEHMDAFQSYPATQALTELVEGLSNWYVRRSRERFWADGREQDKLDAYWTLYTCLRDLAVLLAPFIPFSAEDMYQNLVVDAGGEGHPESVHFVLYPQGDAAQIDEALSRDMAEIRALVSLGLQVRAKEKLKTRQALRGVQIVLSSPARRAALTPYLDIMKEELNVRRVDFIDRADEFVSYRVKPNFATLGKRLGSRMKATQKAVAAQPADALRRALDTEGVVRLDVDGHEVELGRDDLLVSVVAKEGYAAASDPVGVVILDTQLDEALIADGLFREVLSRIQARRKDMALDFAARIRLGLEGSPRLVDICRDRAEELKKETLTVELVFGQPVGGTPSEVQIDGETLRIDVDVVGTGRR